MFTSEQLGGVAEITTDAQAWAMAQHIAPGSSLSLAQLFTALSEPLAAAELEDKQAPAASSAAADTLPAAEQRAS